MATASPETKPSDLLFELQKRAECLRKQESSELTPQEAIAISKALTSIFDSIKRQHHSDSEPAFGYWSIPDTDSRFTRKQLTAMTSAGMGYRSKLSGVETELVCYWRPEKRLSPLLSVVINEQVIRRGRHKISARVEEPGLPSRSFSYTFLE